MTQQTVLNALHRRLGARMVDFGGWDMPLHYGSQLEEHHQVRRHVGLFDVSHMTVVDLEGAACRAFLARLLANDVAKLKVAGKALYTCMLNTHGGVIDDLIVYFLAEDRFRLVVNAATRDKDLAWIRHHAEGFAVSVTERRDLAMIAVQGPEARALVHAGLSAEGAAAAAGLSRFAAVEVDACFIARTGYTGEDGYEVILPADAAETQWLAWMDAGAKPAGLGARDTLRLEAGMNLYGQDMDEATTPFEAGLAWTVVLTPERDFIGADALRAQQAAGVPRQLVGLVLDDKGVLRHGQIVTAEGLGEGKILSGTFAPTVGKGIALARIPAGTPGAVTVTIRDRQVPVRLVKPPFVKGGQPAV